MSPASIFMSTMEKDTVELVADSETELAEGAGETTPEVKAVPESKKIQRKPPESQTGSISFVVVISLIVSLGGVLGGYSHGFPSPTLLDLQEAYDEGDRVTAFSSSSVYAGLFGVSLSHTHPLTSHRPGEVQV